MDTGAIGGVLTVGTFDGFHLGHKHVLSCMRNYSSKNKNIPTVVVSFSNHPRSVLFPEQRLELLSTFEEKIELFEKENIDFIYLIEFTTDFSSLSAEQFVEMYILPINPSCLIVGREHFFGKNREGSFEVLQQLGNKYNFSVIEAPEFNVNGISVSSTSIRKHLLSGKIEKANEMLGYRYFFSGKVMEGNRFGSQLGYPTANLKLHDNKLVPARGVYAAFAFFNRKKYPGMLYIGSRPTFNDNHNISIEMYIFSFSENLYDKVIRIEPVKRIRDDMKFSDKNELIKKIKSDEKTTKEILKIC